MRTRVLFFLICLLAKSGLADSPFAVTLRQVSQDRENREIAVHVAVPDGHVLYAGDKFGIKVDGKVISVQTVPQPIKQKDVFGEEELVFTSPVEAVLKISATQPATRIDVDIQGCTDTVCLPPETVSFIIDNIGNIRQSATDTPVVDSSVNWLEGFEIAGIAAGYAKSSEFIDFLDRAESGDSNKGSRGWLQQFTDDPLGFVKEHGLLWTCLLVLIGGLLLNLTPCVLPMIPINLGIIGAGAVGGDGQNSRGRGFGLGTAYGAGIAVVYGSLGLLVLVTGSVFGSLQGSPWFNGAIAIIFAVLTLALLDIIAIDFTRFQKGGGKGGRIGAAFAAGGISALMAGACVAPVVMAVLILAGSLYAQGVIAALFLPFLLGLGMALPWPLAGAGLSLLPKPGRWMVWVKYGFAVLVAVMAFYYGSLAWRGFRPVQPPSGSIIAGDMSAWKQVLSEAKAEKSLVLVDFWATWCKNCSAMEHSTFRDPKVSKRLATMRVVKVQAEKPDVEPARSMLQALGATGLPTYLVLRPVD